MHADRDTTVPKGKKTALISYSTTKVNVSLVVVHEIMNKTRG